MRLHPVAKLDEQPGFGKGRSARCGGCDLPRHGQERDKAARPDKEMAQGATGIAQALLVVQGLPKDLKRLRIQLLGAEPRLGCPVCEAVNASQELADRLGLIPLGFQPVHEPIEMGTGRAGAVAHQRRRCLEIRRQHAALLQWSP